MSDFPSLGVVLCAFAPGAAVGWWLGAVLDWAFMR